MENKIRILDPNTEVFEANGKIYRFEPNLNMYRYWQFARFSEMLKSNFNFTDLFNYLVDVMNKMADVVKDPQTGMEVYHEIRQYLASLNGLNEREPIAFWISTLFWNTEDEDVTKWSEELGKQKMEDWQDIDAGFFLANSIPLIKDFLVAYKKLMENISEIQKIQGDLITDLTVE